MASVVNKIRKPKNRKNKIELTFDPENRREFLTGFHKRKQQKKKAAEEKLVQALKEEKKRLKKEARETYKKLVGAYRPAPLFENLFSNEYEEGDVTVKVMELSTSEIASQNNWIGENRPQYEDEESNEETIEESSDYIDIPGMELETKNKQKNVVENVATFNSKKEIKRVLMKEATLKMQKSKAYQMKNRFEQRKNRQKAKKLNREKEKLEKRKKKYARRK